jgi:hypothetical protein
LQNCYLQQGIVKQLDPIASLDYVHNRNEKNNQRISASTPVSRFDAFHASNSKSNWHSTPPADKRPKGDQPRRTPPLLPLHPSASKSFPPPNSGMQYTKKEIINLWLPLKRQERSHWIDQLVEKNLVPVKRCMLYRMLQKAKRKILNGKIPDPDEPWDNRGRPALLNMLDMKSFVQNLEQTVGRTARGKEIVMLLNKSKEREHLNEGWYPSQQKLLLPPLRLFGTTQQSWHQILRSV